MNFFSKRKKSSTPGPAHGPSSQGLASTFPETRIGCEIVYEGKSPLEAEYVHHSIVRASQIMTSGFTSLVFVHGIGGHWYNTWSKNGVFWPRDLLSRDVQNVRIITFGYDSDVVGFLGRASWNPKIRDHARTLTADLRRCRKKGDEVRYHKAFYYETT